jgi:ATP synthase protein I
MRLLLRTVIAKIIGLQVLVTVLAVLAAFYLGGAVAAWSAGIGGAIGFIPSAAYGAVVLRRRFGEPRSLLQRHYFGEFSKLVLTLLLFAAAFAWVKTVSPLPLFGTYGLTLAVYWAALLLFT